MAEPLVTIGQGDTQRTITEEDVARSRGVPGWLAVAVLWLAFAVGAALLSVTRR